MSDLDKLYRSARRWTIIGIIGFSLSIVGWTVYLVAMLIIIIGGH